MNKLTALSLVFFGCTQADTPPVVTCEGATHFQDSDGDGFGDPDVASCEPRQGFVDVAGDCDDSLAEIHPAAIEGCDQIDNNCDGTIDDADPEVDVSLGGTLFFRDGDGDGFGATGGTRACAKPTGFVTNDDDCDDAASAVNPNAAEVCDLIDNNCNAQIDMDDAAIDLSTAASYFTDADGDSFGSGPAQLACTQPSGTTTVAGDCNDADNSSKPGGTEKCDGRDNNCDGGNDGTPAAPNQCAALVGTYSGTYQHVAQEKLGSTVINTMSCSGTGSGSLVLDRTNALQGSFGCTFPSGGGLFDQSQSVVLRAEVSLGGAVTGTVEHTYRSSTLDPLKRTYNVTGTLTGSTLSLTGTGQVLPHPMSAVPWQVSYSFAATR